MLTLVTVDEHRVIYRVEHELDNLADNFVIGVDIDVFIRQDVDLVVSDAICAHEGLVIERNVFWHECDDGFEFVLLENGEVGSLWVASAVYARSDLCKIDRQTSTIGSRRLRLVLFHGDRLSKRVCCDLWHLGEKIETIEMVDVGARVWLRNFGWKGSHIWCHSVGT